MGTQSISTYWDLEDGDIVIHPETGQPGRVETIERRGTRDSGAVYFTFSPISIPFTKDAGDTIIKGHPHIN